MELQSRSAQLISRIKNEKGKNENMLALLSFISMDTEECYTNKKSFMKNLESLRNLTEGQVETKSTQASRSESDLGVLADEFSSLLKSEAKTINEQRILIRKCVSCLTLKKQEKLQNFLEEKEDCRI